MHKSLQHWQRAVREAALNMEEDMNDVLVPHLKERIATLQAQLEAVEKSREEWREDALTIAKRSLELERRNKELEKALGDLSDRLLKEYRDEVDRAIDRVEQPLLDLVRRIPL